MYRLIAEEDKVLINGNIITTCTDVSTIEDWTETESPEGWGKPDFSEKNIWNKLRCVKR